ncbi:hypothetical protein CLU83_3409 [Flavobacterium sp. 1]|nr:hypothetical protein CLU83_3409 [Flavobacterium sp. 1]
MFLQSCNGKLESSTLEIINNYSFNSAISNSDKIIIRQKKANQTEANRDEACFENKSIFETEKTERIESFKKLFENSKYTDYCCCPETNYSIDFYKKSEKIVSFFADTSQNKNKVRVFESNFQYSYLIDKNKWNLFLNQIKVKRQN